MTTKILLIAYHFPPLNSVASSRTYAFARYLAEQDYAVTVLTVDHRGDGCNLFLDTSGDRYRVVMADSIRNVNRNSSLLANSSGAGTADFIADARFRLKKFLSYRVLGNLITTADRWFFKARRMAHALMREERFDIIISTFSPVSCHAIAWGLKRKFPGTFWVADYRDLWSLNECVPRPIFPLSLLQKLVERFLNGRADLVTTVSEPLRHALQNAWGRRTFVVENGYFPWDEGGRTEVEDGFTKRFTFSYTGSIYRNKQDPAPFFKAIRELIDEGRLAEDDVEVRFYGENSYLLKRLVQECGLSGIVTLLPMVSRDESLAVQKRSTGLLFLENDDPSSRGVLTGKLFEYMVSGTPIVAVGITPEHEAGKVIRRTGTGFVCGMDVHSIKDAVMRTVAGEAFAPDREKIAEYRRDRLVKKLARIIEENRPRGSRKGPDRD